MDALEFLYGLYDIPDLRGDESRVKNRERFRNYYSDFFQEDANLTLSQRIHCVNKKPEIMPHFKDPNLLFGELDQTADDFHIQVDSPRQTLFSYKSASLLENSAELRSWVTRTSPVNACGWTVTLERPEKIVFASVRKMGRVIMAILFICVVIIFSITQLFTSFFEQKISALHYYLQRIKEGHLDYHIHDDSTDELGDLTNNLQAMIDEINRLIREDYQTKIELKET